jgi:hypothetical protein
MKTIVMLFTAACITTAIMLCVVLAMTNPAHADEAPRTMPRMLYCFTAEFFQKDLHDRFGETLTGGGDLSGGGRLVIFEGNTSYTIAVIRIDGLVCTIASGSSVKHSQFRKGTAS